MGAGEAYFLKQDDFFCTRNEICNWKQHFKDFKIWILETSNIFDGVVIYEKHFKKYSLTFPISFQFCSNQCARTFNLENKLFQ